MPNDRRIRWLLCPGASATSVASSCSAVSARCSVPLRTLNIVCPTIMEMKLL